MPIYEYACPKCRVIFNFLSKRVNPDRTPACPKCGNRKMIKQMSRFAMTRGLQELGAFQSKLRPLVNPHDAALAADWHLCAQQIINALCLPARPGR